MMMHRLLVFALALLGLASATGCTPDNLTEFDFQDLQPPSPPDEPTGDALIGTATDNGVQVELLAARGGAHLGYVRFGLRITENGTAVSQATLGLAASPTAGPAAGAALPVEAVASQADAEGLFRGAAFLLSPDTTARSFTLRTTVRTASGTQAEVTFPVDARSSIWMQPTDAGLVSWVDPLRPVVGANTYAVAVHRWTGTAFEPVDQLEPTLYPYMDMGGGDGHSTPHGTVEPLGNGRYRWSVEFIMSGGWEMTVTLAPTASSTAHFVGYTVYEP